MKMLMATVVLSFAVTAFAAADFKAQIVSMTEGRAQSDLAQSKSILFIGYLNGCPLFKKSIGSLKKLQEKFGKSLVIINYDPAISARENAKESRSGLAAIGNPFPLAIDPEGALNEKLGITLASEVAVVDARTFELVYRGSIDDRLTLDFERPQANHNYAETAVQLAVDGRGGKLPFTAASGCTLNIKKR